MNRKLAAARCATLALLLAPLTSCGVLGGASDRVQEARILTVPDGTEIDIDSAARELRRADVIFLGELHDSLEGHRVMTELTRAILADHPQPVLSMEMFERDVQDVVTLYVDGYACKDYFLANARPWDSPDSPYADHYGPVVDLARENGWDVVAANVPRRAARAVARSEAPSSGGSIFASPVSDLSDGRYRREFDETMNAMMGGHGSGMTDFSLMYAAQVLKDETMAHAIASLFRGEGERGGGGRWPRVVHWNGRFHSDWGLGTVERLRRRLPGLRIAVVTMERDGGLALATSDDPPASYVIQVP
ncbi:hypothetical protein Pla163_27130 [Planctomycetes bacterium Pla163]|uniref:Haem-binding uptake Tiki superfamily ChaN domain-containing protein n=1 Tax=Rohdeia mirabilis TaxID=2528008 RepID=A0A518D276_9BACT|nr:hypothetical protein Pla163_27130 [Planctomycetes bacterium Pla163]